jgi:hypothetical protein
VGFAHPLHIDAYCVGGHRRTLGTRGNRCLNLLVSQDSETLRLWNAESHIWPNTMGLRFQLRFLPRVSISFPSSIRVSSFSEGYPHSGSGKLFVRKNATRKMIVFDPEFRPKQTLRNHPFAAYCILTTPHHLSVSGRFQIPISVRIVAKTTSKPIALR